MLMLGEPGCGKTMIAQRIPTILPQMTEKESLEVTKIHGIAGLLNADGGLPDVPIVLYVRGKLKINEFEKSVGIVGARRCSQEGKQQAIRTAEREVLAGAAVISGMAKGIDSYAHTAALKNDGYTVAVLGSGPDVCYPREHERLYEEMITRGCVLSECLPGTEPRGYLFPRRNRLIAALSDEVHIIDVGRHSGTETTVEKCMEYGRKVVMK